MEFKRTGIAPNSAYLGSLGGSKVSKTDISYPQSYKEDDEAFDHRLDVPHGRDTGYSFEEARVHGGAPAGGYAPYGGGYETVPGGDDGYAHTERPTSLGGPLGGNRI